MAGLERMNKHLTCMVAVKSSEAEQSTKEERAWKQSGNLTIHQQSLRVSFHTPLHYFTQSKKIQKIKIEDITWPHGDTKFLFEC